jgi:hypothetical protein
MHRYLLVVVFLLFGEFARVHSARADITAAFLDIGYGARPMGMGGAFVAVCDDAQAIFWNPAGLRLLENAHLTLMHTRQFGLIPYTTMAFAFPYGKQSLGIGAIASGDAFLHETSLLVSYARSFSVSKGSLHIGLNLQYRMATFGNDESGGEERSRGSASGYAMELGFLWEPSENLRIGTFLRNLINNMTYDNTARKVVYREKVPFRWTLGLSRSFGSALLFALDWEPRLYDDVPGKLRLGAEFRPMRMMVFRGGFWQNLSADINRHFALGAGLNIRRAKIHAAIDFAYLFSDLANSQRISLSLFY